MLGVDEDPAEAARWVDCRGAQELLGDGGAGEAVEGVDVSRSLAFGTCIWRMAILLLGRDDRGPGRAGRRSPRDDIKSGTR